LSSIRTTLAAKGLALLAHRALQLGIFHAPPQHVQQVKVLALDPPGGADAEIAELGGLVGGVPALHDAVELVGAFVRCVAPEPRRLDHAAAQWRRGLLALAGDPRNEVSGGLFAQGAADLLEHVERLALGMQGLARSAAEGLLSEHRLDPVQLVIIRNCRQPHDLPRLLR